VILACGTLEIDPARRQLRCHGREVATQPLIFDLLLYFAHRPHVLVTKDALIRDVWKGVSVGDGAISQAISLLRRTLRADGGLPRPIHTVWGKGYRFTADVRQGGNGKASPASARDAANGRSSLAMRPDARLLIGRAKECTVLDAALASAVAGRGGLVAVTGEPGIGKTRLVEELAAGAAAAGVRVVWGWCWEAGGAPAFWPWTQVLRALAGDADARERRETFEPTAAVLSRILPELDGNAEAAPAASDSAAARFVLFDAVAAFLDRAASRRPLVVILEDVHAADLASLHLLGVVARGARTMPLLVVVTHREHEVRRRPDLSRILADVAREGTNLPLQGLTDADVERIVADGFELEPTAGMVRALQASTGGNPFLLREVVGTLVTAGGLDEIGLGRAAVLLPSAAAELIRRHLDWLPPDAREALRKAAVIGVEFSLRELGAVCDGGADAMREQLREAADIGVVVCDSPVGTRYRFRHALFREVLASELSTAARRALHGVLGEAIEREHRTHPDPWLDRLAYHFLRGADPNNWRRAVQYAEDAAARASKRLAYEDADAYLEAALEVCESVGDDEQRRCELLLALGAHRRKATGLEAARAVFARAYEVARGLGRPDLLARAALGFTPWTAYGRVSESGVPLLEEALAAQADAHGPLKAALLARLAYNLEGTAGARVPKERVVALSREGVGLARRCGDGTVLGRALFESRWVEWDPATFASRRATTEELVAVAQELGDHELAVVGEGWRVADAFEIGDPVALDQAMRRHAALASELREPEHLWWSAVWRATSAVAQGRYAESDGLVADALEIGRRVEPENALLVAYVQSSQCGMDRGRIEEGLVGLEQVVAGRPEVFEGDPTVACRRARLLVELGRTVEAGRELERLAVDDFRVLRLDMRYADNLAALALVAAALGDRERAAAIDRRLRPAHGRHLVFGPGLGVAGPTAHYRGLLASAMGRHADARRHFEAALRMSERMGWMPLATRTRYEYAAMLLARGHRGDRALAARLLDRAERAADALGLERLGAAVAALRKD
jgi:DNA-binding winged helix-turn-helix (wHTH) protein/tetratricopeptide (TPR) repeat protein